MMKSLFSALLLSLGLAAPVCAAAAGTAVGVDPDAAARHEGAERVLVVGDDVSVGDRITTGATGKVQLLFDDDTRIVVGPRSTLEIEAYLLKGGGVDRFAVNALAGTFRFITGNSPKPAYSIHTPTASIAVRGTKFDFTVATGTTRVLLFDGAVTLCKGTTCVDLVNRCDMGEVGNTARVLTWSEDRGRFDGNFPLPNIQSRFLPKFRIPGAQACLTPPVQPSLDSLSTNGDTSGSPISTPPSTQTNTTQTQTTPTFNRT